MGSDPILKSEASIMALPLLPAETLKTSKSGSFRRGEAVAAVDDEEAAAVAAIAAEGESQF